MAGQDPTRILHLISTLDVGGAETNLLDLVRRLDQRDFRSVVVSMTTVGAIGRRIRDAGIEVSALDMPKGMPDPRGIPRLHDIVRSFRPHIIQSWMYHANLFSLLFKAGKRIVWGIFCSDMDLGRYGAVYRITARAGALTSRVPDAVVVNSRAGMQAHETLGYRPRKWEVIANGFDTCLFRPDPAAGAMVRSELSIPDDAVVIGMIAREDPMKDHGAFLRAAQLLAPDRPETHFVLAGRGIDRDNAGITAAAGSLLKTGRLHLLGERTDIPHILNALDISTLASLSEGLPNVIGESMAAGVPCVATDAGDSALLIGDTGLVVPRQTPRALAQAWERLVRAGASSRSGLGVRARQRIIEHYGMDAMTRHYATLYAGLVTPSPPSAS